MAYIYKIINDINQKVYIGQTSRSIDVRWKEHQKSVNREQFEIRPLYRAIKKYGIENFHIELIEETNNPNDREKYWIEYYQSFKKGYNATLGGEGKPYIDKNIIIATYNQVHNIDETARITNHDKHIISNILKENNISILSQQKVNYQTYGKIVGQFSKETGKLLNTFGSLKEAGRFINKPMNHISACANGKRKSAYGYVWKFL